MQLLMLERTSYCHSPCLQAFTCPVARCPGAATVALALVARRRIAAKKASSSETHCQTGILNVAMSHVAGNLARNTGRIRAVCQFSTVAFASIIVDITTIYIFQSFESLNGGKGTFEDLHLEVSSLVACPQMAPLMRFIDGGRFRLLLQFTIFQMTYSKEAIDVASDIFVVGGGSLQQN